jgi:hypothetical protein
LYWIMMTFDFLKRMADHKIRPPINSSVCDMKFLM